MATRISGSCIDGPNDKENIFDGYVPLRKLYDLVASETKWTLIMVPCSEAVAIYIPLEERTIAARGARCASISQCDWSSMTLYNNTDPLTVLAGRAKKQLSKLGENAQSPEKERKKERKREKNTSTNLSIQCHVNSAEFKI